MLRLLDRYILREVLGPLVLGFVVYTFILLIQALFKSAELIIGSGVPISIVGRLLLLSVPHIVVMTIPMSLLFGILIGVGRLSTDSELIAIRAGGISLFSLYRPILILSTVLMALNVYLMLEVMPKGNRALQDLRVDILTRSLTEEIQPRLPNTGWGNQMLYIFEAPADERIWKGVFLSESIPTIENQTIVAQRGRARTNPETGLIQLQLDSAATHVVDLDKPDAYNLVSQEEYAIRLVAETQQAEVSVSKSIRELRLSALRRLSRAEVAPDLEERAQTMRALETLQLERPLSAEETASLETLRQTVPHEQFEARQRNFAKVEIHKRFSFPFACIVFGLLGLPLGFSNARGGRSAGFALSIFIIVLYYVIFNTGEEAARDGSLPAWLAVWLPNVLMLIAGLFILARRNRDKSLLIQSVDRWIQESLWSRLLRVKNRRERKRAQRRARMRSARESADLVLRLPDLRLRFPNQLDRYILSTFLRVLGIASLSAVAVYLVADITENVEDILEHQISSSVLFEYYQYKTFAIIYEIAPIIVLITTLSTFGLLSRTNEIIAAKALGISVFRMALPVLLAASLVAGLAGVLQSEVLPSSNGRVAELHEVIKGRTGANAIGQRADRRWLYGQGNRLYNYSYYDPERRELQRLQIFQFDDDYNLVGRLFAERANHIENDWWIVAGGWARTFDGAEVTGYSTFDEPMKYQLTEEPAYFQGGLTSPEEMNYADLESYIQELEGAGQRVPALRVALYDKIAYPIITLVMALVALPFAFRMGRRGALYGVGISLVVGIFLMIIMGVFRALGEGGLLPPLAAVWSPSAIFTIFSLYLFLGVRS